MRNRQFLDGEICAIAHSSTTRTRWPGYCAIPRPASFNEHIAQDGPVVLAHACWLGAEGIVSKRVDDTYRSGPCRVSIKVRNPASIAVQREREGDLEPMSPRQRAPDENRPVSETLALRR
jgi:hypothetical protein